MGQMKVNIEAFRQAGLFDGLRVMVGGAAVSEEYAAAIGAHGYGKDATSAVARAKELLAEVRAARGVAGT
jgi:5-methyltetrahydrofolate--homocysteine methyltransferase